MRLSAVIPISETTDNGLAITGLTDYGKTLDTIVIPEKIGDGEVTTIGGGAFEDNTAVISVVIPATVITVENNAFKGCEALSSVIFERGGDDGVTVLGEGVFQGCSVLVTIIVPEDSLAAYTEAVTQAAPEAVEKIVPVAKAEEVNIYQNTGFVQCSPEAPVHRGRIFQLRGHEGFCVLYERNLKEVTAECLVYIEDGVPASSRALRVSDLKVKIVCPSLPAPNSVELAIEVVPAVVEKTVKSVTVSVGKTQYTEGENFNAAGLSLVIAYSDGTTERNVGL
jgi:hypothetical protein